MIFQKKTLPIQSFILLDLAGDIDKLNQLIHPIKTKYPSRNFIFFSTTTTSPGTYLSFHF